MNQDFILGIISNNFADGTKDWKCDNSNGLTGK
jgi:hypothetical protein